MTDNKQENVIRQEIREKRLNNWSFGGLSNFYHESDWICPIPTVKF